MSSSPLSAGKHTTTINNLAINYLVIAEKPNLPVILVHPPPWGVGSEFYIGIFSCLSSRYTVVIPSPRGNDDSERPSAVEDMTSRHIVDDLDSLRQHLGLETFPVVVGHSAGGTIAIGYGVAYPTRVEKLILLNSALLGYTPKDTSFFTDIKTKFEEAPPTTDEEFKAFIISVLPLYFARPDEATITAFANAWKTTPKLWAYGAYYAADSGAKPEQVTLGKRDPQWKLIDELGKVTAKTLVMTGRKDRTCAPEVSEAIASGIKGSQLVIVEDCAHLTWAEQPDFFWKTIEEFLEAKV